MRRYSVKCTKNSNSLLDIVRELCQKYCGTATIESIATASDFEVTGCENGSIKDTASSM